MRRHQQPFIVGVAWFRPDQWQLLRSFASDAEILEQNFTEWEVLAEKAIRDLTRRGLTIRKVDVDVHELQKWCAAQHRPLDGAARAAYAQARLANENERT